MRQPHRNPGKGRHLWTSGHGDENKSLAQAGAKISRKQPTAFSCQRSNPSPIEKSVIPTGAKRSERSGGTCCPRNAGMSDLGLVADPPTGVGTRTIPFEMNLGSTHRAAVSASSLVNQ